MDALSALKLVGAPNLASPLTNVAQGGGATPAMSPAEMQQLSSLMQAGGATPTTSPAELGQLPPGLELTAPGGTSLPTSDPSSFQNMLGGFVKEVSDKQAAAGEAVSGLLSGKNVSLHQAMISVEEASVSFQLMVEVRNRLLDSYQELMRMQV
jgi:flagellar hook-basal body complex protein FliE